MATYPNGKIPDRLLVRRGDLVLTAGTWAKFDDFSSRIKRRVGVTLTIPNGSIPGARGEGAYRKYDMQVIVKAYWAARGQGRMAAAPGYSSHGGEFNGQDALAIDIDNWARVPLHIFYEEGRNAGFQMGYFDGKGGRPYEPWHIIDRDPYRRVGSQTAGGESAKEWDEMATMEEIKAAVAQALAETRYGTGGRNLFDLGNDARGYAARAAAAAEANTAAAVWAHPIVAQDGTGMPVIEDGKPVTFAAHGYLASAVAQLGAKLGTAEVDEAALAKALAPLLTANLSSLSDEDVKRIANAAADEQARRLNG